MPRKWLVAGMLVSLCFAASAQADTGFFRKLLKAPKTSVLDAYRGIAYLVLDAAARQEAEKAGTYEAYRSALLAADVISGQWDYQPDDPATKGLLGYLACRAIPLRGGLTIRLFGLSQRYALLECIDQEIIDRGGTHKSINGRELLSILKAIEDEMIKRTPQEGVKP